MDHYSRGFQKALSEIRHATFVETSMLMGLKLHISTSWQQTKLGKVGFQSDQIIAASWSGNTCRPSNQLIITLIRLLLDQN